MRHVPDTTPQLLHLPSGEVRRTLGPFDSQRAACAAVIEAVGQVLLWERQSTGAFVAEKYPLLWVIKAREAENPRPLGPDPPENSDELTASIETVEGEAVVSVVLISVEILELSADRW